MNSLKQLARETFLYKSVMPPARNLKDLVKVKRNSENSHFLSLRKLVKGTLGFIPVGLG